jgi:hypothetical protein
VFFAWMKLTEEGERVAQALEEGAGNP